MDANTQVTLDEFYSSVVADIRAKFPQFVTVEFDREDRRFTAAECPACLLEISEFDDAAGNDPQTEQWATTARVEARVVLGFRTDAAKKEVRKAATSLAVWLRHRRFNRVGAAGKLPTPSGCLVAGCFQDDFDPDMDEFEVWRVEWLQRLELGETIWTPGGPPPNPVYSYAPDIGNGHAQDYKPVIAP